MSESPRLLTRRELVLAFLGILLVLLGQTFAGHAQHLFFRHFWNDELLSLFIVEDPDPRHALHALATGMDQNPPLYHLLLRGFLLVAPGSIELRVRAFSFLAVAVMFVGVYALLRARFAPLTSVVGVAAVWCHPAVQFQAFEGRAYALWLASFAWFCVALECNLQYPPTRGSRVLLAVTAVGLCTSHYLGVVSLGLAVLPYVLRMRRVTVRATLGAMAPIVAGGIALLACLPLLRSQLHLSKVATWIPPLSEEQALEFVTAITPVAVTLVVVPWFVMACARLARGTIDRAEGPLVGQVLLPLVILGISTWFVPMQLARYASPFALAVAPAIATLVDRRRALHRGVLLAVLFVYPAFFLHDSADNRRAYMDAGRGGRAFDEEWDPVIDAAGKRGVPVVVESSVVSNVVLRYARAKARDFLVTTPQRVGKKSGPLPPPAQYVADLVRAQAASYGTPHVAAWTEVRALGVFEYIPGPSAETPLPDGTTQIRPLEGCTARHVMRHLFELSCSSDAIPPSP